MILEQRDYHVYTGKLPELVRLYEDEGIAIQQRGARRLRRRVHDGRRRALDLHAPVALRQLRRARGASRAAAGARRLEGVPGEDPAADPHAAEPDPRADVLLAARGEPWASSTARSRSSRAARRASAHAIAHGLAADGARIVVADLQRCGGGGGRAPGRRRADRRRGRRGRRAATGRRDRRAMRGRSTSSSTTPVSMPRSRCARSRRSRSRSGAG